MNKRQLKPYQRVYASRYRRSTDPVSGLLLLVIVGIVTAGLVMLYENARAPRVVRSTPAPTRAARATAIAPQPTQTPAPVLSLPTVQSALETTLLAPTAGIRSTVVDVFLNGTSWDVSSLGDRVGRLQGTAAFGASGNLGLAGHIEMADGRPGIFARLNQVSLGDPVIIKRGAREKRYQVTDIRLVWPDDLTVLHPTDSDRLTLITCSEYNFWQDVYRKRFVVVAERAL